MIAVDCVGCGHHYEAAPVGAHRVLCGDATDALDVARLVSDSQVALLLTDPPYNVGVDYGSTTDDRRVDTEYDGWLQQWFTVGRSVVERAIVTPGAVNLERWLRLFPADHVGVWIKGMGAITHGRVTKYWAWEPLMFHGSHWKRERHIDVFEYPGGGTQVDHPCPKPIGLWADLIENFSEPGDVILDVLAGSGTTIVAAEQTSRTAYLMELSPAYCDVIVRRWEHITGRTAVLAPVEVLA